MSALTHWPFTRSPKNCLANEEISDRAGDVPSECLVVRLNQPLVVDPNAAAFVGGVDVVVLGRLNNVTYFPNFGWHRRIIAVPMNFNRPSVDKCIFKMEIQNADRKNTVDFDMQSQARRMFGQRCF